METSVKSEGVGVLEISVNQKWKGFVETDLVEIGGFVDTSVWLKLVAGLVEPFLLVKVGGLVESSYW